ncbi:MAG TPA: MASE3 domain-containing protein [Phycisphaerae bacterium]|jgi:signal transduction histidine kinase/ActR/RegA family two-component response regulator|nr:MASE3 domain-containing protein [Phycisphaerae bacterium]HOJ56427.1 MASE3 domain-containing protein [Phycisphaerae bacterium]HOL28012.1 MASE3 domain-containing protein [Phycisphaerae bacterium]HPP22401.1 MASE3 domain-containing protein [Phycisphaerae bacterium]HQA43445.1 MASE3 domain-containing protein [Phycisphaerae bacterium]
MNSRLRQTLSSSLTVLGVLLGLAWANTHSYLLFHCLAELFSIVIAAGIFMVAWNARRLHENDYLTFLGIAFLFVGATDLVHTLAYKEMNVFVEHKGPDPATQLWLAARYMESLSMLGAVLLVGRKIRPLPVLAGFTVVLILVLLAIFEWHVFPTCFVEGQGLTPFKLISEYVICGILLAAMGSLWWQGHKLNSAVSKLLIAAMAVTILQELSLTLYSDPFGRWNYVGHCLKLVGFYLVYKAIVETGLARPYDLLFLDLKHSEESLRAAKASAERAREVAEEASRAKDCFLAVLSHELRTPLTPVLTTASLLENNPALPADFREDISMIRRNAELEAHLIDDLLDINRIAQGKIELDKRPLELGDVIRQAVEVCKPETAARALSFDFDLGPASRCWIEADAARLQQVFWNLLKNAIKFTPPGGHVGIRCRLENGEASPAAGEQGTNEERSSSLKSEPETLNSMVVVEVHDTGLGIPPESLGRIFRAFEQADHWVTRRFGGLGLGLTITRAIVQMHGGTIEAHSEGMGTGATFRVRLPVLRIESNVPPAESESPGAATKPDAPQSTQQAARPRPLRILLVEDHADTVRVMHKLLKACGHQVQSAGGVTAGLELAIREPFDLLISDLGLPDGSGLELIQALRARGRKLPAIALSGYGQEEDLSRSKAAGFDEHLVKPVDFMEFREVVARYASRTADKE